MCLATQFRTAERQNMAFAGAVASAGAGAGAAVTADWQAPRGTTAERSTAAAAATAAASLPPSSRVSACSGGSVDNQTGEQRGGQTTSNCSTRSRLSGAATGMLGGATAVVAVATRAGEVGGGVHMGLGLSELNILYTHVGVRMKNTHAYSPACVYGYKKDGFNPPVSRAARRSLLVGS